VSLEFAVEIDHSGLRQMLPGLSDKRRKELVTHTYAANFASLTAMLGKEVAKAGDGTYSPVVAMSAASSNATDQHAATPTGTRATGTPAATGVTDSLSGGALPPSSFSGSVARH
jgi:hypothetical protein